MTLVIVLLACACDGGRTDHDGGSDGGGGPFDASPDASRDAGPPTPTERCPGEALTSDATLALDLPAVLLEGSVTLRGAPLPDGAPRGALAIRGSGDQIVIDLGTSGPARYRAVLVPDAYELHYVPAGCEPGASMPCAGGLLARVDLTSDGALDLDVGSITVRGTVRVDGRVVPAGGGAIHFGDAAVAWDEEGRYEVRLIPGTYRVDFVPGTAACGADDPLPCTGGTLLETALASDGVLDLAVSTVEVQGRATANGGAPDVAGALIFEGAAGTATASFDASGAYDVRLWPGDYDVTFGGSGLPCDAVETALPCNAGTILEDVPLPTSGALDIDVPSVLVSGRVRVDGAEPASAAALAIGEASVAFDAAGAYRATVLPGTYDVSYAGAPCAGRSDMPCNSGVIARGVELVTDGVLDVPIETATVIGRVSVRGAAPEDGTLTFEGDELGPASAAWAGDGTYELTVLRGSYRVSAAPLDASCPASGSLPCHAAQVLELELAVDGVADIDVPVVAIEGVARANGASIAGVVRFSGEAGEVSVETSGAYAVRLTPGAWSADYVPAGCPSGGAAPCVPMRAHAAVELASDGVLDLDVPLVRITPQVTLNGAALARDARASVTFVELATDQDPVTGEVAVEDAPLRLVPGRYLVIYDGGASGCGEAGRRWPCASRVLAGCVEEP